VIEGQAAEMLADGGALAQWLEAEPN